MKYSFAKYTLAVLIGIAAFLFWWLWHPELVSFHEQNQLFLFTSNYLTERLSVAGGLADYISEFLVQFFFYIGIGAAVIGLVLAALHVLLSTAIEKQQKEWRVLPQLIALTITLLMWAHMMDENTLLSYPIAIILSLAAYLLCRRGGWMAQLIVSLPLYWCVGPAFVVQTGLALIDAWKTKEWKQALLASVALVGVAGVWVYICRTLWVAQYPWNTVLAGINYHRLTLMMCEAPQSQYNILLILLITYGCTLLIEQISRSPRFKALAHIEPYLTVGCALVIGICQVSLAFGDDNHHDINTHALLEQQYLVRKSNWNDIITKADAYKNQHIPALNTPLSANSVNLALAMTGQMASRMFEFPQSGIQGLLMPNVRDNVSNVITMEAFWQLGFVNEAMRYAFDSQESIPNCRKSGRYLRRMAECNIVNGHYEVASKYLSLLKQSLFYRSWAETAETYLYDEERIASNPEWQRLRSVRLTADFLYFYPEMPKMLGQLLLRDRNNHLAYDYFMASLLLKGDVNSYVANLPQQPQPGQDPFPRGYRAYIDYMQQQGNTTDAVTSATSSNK